jgi:Domain of unknown function (DUF5615)
MARLYADEQYPYAVAMFLRSFGHDILTVQEAGKANQRISDSEVLSYATNENRAVITQNRKDFILLHRLRPDHAGIIVCTDDRDWEALAHRVHASIMGAETLQGKLIRVVRPA